MGLGRYFDLDKLPTEGLKREIRPFIVSRGSKLTLSSMRGDFTQYNILCGFLREKEPALQSLREKGPEELVHGLKVWLMKHGHPTTMKKKRVIYGTEKMEESENIRYLRKLLAYVEPEDTRPEYEKDVWRLDALGEEPYKSNPIRRIKTISFTGISQPEIRREIKDVIHMDLRSSCLDTVLAELGAVRRFTKYLKEDRGQVRSLLDLDREDVEGYLTYLNTGGLRKKCFRSELYHLKSVLQTAGRMMESAGLEGLFHEEDIPRGRRTVYESYSDGELIRLNRNIVTMDEQVARALILHQMLGTRISDTLTLTPDCLYISKDTYIIRIQQVKGGYYEKPVSKEVADLIMESIAYTRARHGDVPYIFACGRNPQEPFQYSMMQDQVRTMIVERDLRDDNGERFGFNTHLFRHTYGRKLTEMHLDDYTLARLLGHANTGSVKYYRKMSDGKLESETRGTRESMDAILRDIIGRWKAT